MSIGNRIRDLRWDARLAQGELARRAGIAQNTLSQIELGKTTPSVPTLEKIARGLNMNVSELLEEPAVPLDEAPQGSGQAEPRGPGLDHMRSVSDSVSVSDEVIKADVQLEKVRQILSARDTGEMSSVAALEAIKRESLSA
jgi:transcriptional regulator with XRE-family HTH domain